MSAPDGCCGGGSAPEGAESEWPRTGLSTGRRRFVSFLATAGAAVAGLVAAIPFLGVVLAPARSREGPVWRGVGRADAFPLGSTTLVTYPDPDPDPWTGMTVRNAAWLRRELDGAFTAFSIYCTHTGCPVRWQDDAEFFLCPCHGGVFDRSGLVVAGPPPRPLEQPPVRVLDGRVEILAIGIPVPE